MPEKVRVSPATALQLSTGGGQAALEPEDDELLEDEDDPEDPVADDPEDVDEEVDEEEDEDEPDDEADDSAFAGAEPLPDDRLSVR